MELNKLIEEIKQYAGSEEFENYVVGLMTDDRVKKYLTTDSGKRLLQPQLDSYFNKGLESWKTNNLAGLVDAEVKKRYPDADPKDIELNNLKAELARIKAESLRKDLTIKAQAYATEKGLPAELVDYFVGTDEDTTTANMDKFAKVYAASIASGVDAKIKSTSHVPPAGNEQEPDDGVTAAFKELNKDIKF